MFGAEAQEAQKLLVLFGFWWFWWFCWTQLQVHACSHPRRKLTQIHFNLKEIKVTHNFHSNLKIFCYCAAILKMKR